MKKKDEKDGKSKETKEDDEVAKRVEERKQSERPEVTFWPIFNFQLVRLLWRLDDFVGTSLKKG